MGAGEIGVAESEVESSGWGLVSVVSTGSSEEAGSEARAKEGRQASKSR